MVKGLVSIVIPCYNQSHFLGDAIESVLMQTYPNLELIVVDDGSTDDTAAIAARYDIVKYVKQNNRGLASARNSGFKISNGDYIVFLDADDRLLPDGLQSGIDVLRANPTCALSYGHVIPISVDGSRLAFPSQIAINENHYLELLKHNYIWTPGSVVYRRSALEAVGAFDPSYGGSADYDLNLRITKLWPARCCDKPVLEYRRHDQSMSRDYRLMLKSAVSIRRAHLRSLKGNPSYQALLRGGIRAVQEDYGEKLVDAVGKSLKQHKWRRTLGGLTTLLRYYPQGLVRHARARVANFVLGLQH